MPYFKGKAINMQGEKVSYARKATSKEQLVIELKSVGLYPVHTKVIREESRRGLFRKKYGFKTILDFTETLNHLVSSGLSLKDALSITLTIYRKGAIHEITAMLLADIEKGTSFEQSLAAFEPSFPPIYRGLIKIGEKTGDLENVFQRLTNYLREKKLFKDKLLNAAAYPLFILSVAVAGVILLSTFIMPKVTEIYTQVGLGLPEEMLNRMRIFNRTLWVGGLVILFLAIYFVFFKWTISNNSSVKEKWDRFLLKIPFYGRFRQYRDNLSFLFAMETLIESGFAIEDAIDESSRTIDNLALAKALQRIEAEIRRGKQLSLAFLNEDIIPNRVGQWLMIGEQSGNVKKVFSQLRHYFQEEINRWSSRMMSFAEPAFMIVIGIIISVFLLVFILPIFSIYRDLL